MNSLFKILTKLSAFTLLALFVLCSSCKKDRSCVCLDNNGNFSSESGLFDMTLTDAKSMCNTIEEEGRKTTPGLNCKVNTP